MDIIDWRKAGEKINNNSNYKDMFSMSDLDWKSFDKLFVIENGQTYRDLIDSTINHIKNKEVMEITPKAIILAICTRFFTANDIQSFRGIWNTIHRDFPNEQEKLIGYLKVIRVMIEYRYLM